MGVTNLDLVLSITTFIVVLADILLALCLRFVLPKHITHSGYYPADGRTVTYAEALDRCPCLARVFPEGTKDDIKLIKIDEKMTRRRRKRQIEEASEKPSMGPYSFLVSLSIPAYIDDLNQKIFACNGFVQTRNTLITSNSCVKNESEWNYITVRSGSAYWSKLGQQHRVIDVKYVDYDLVILEVDPPFPEETVPSPGIKYPYKGNWTYSFTAGWDDQMYKKKQKFRYKYKKFDVEEWTAQECGNKTEKICFGDGNCTKTSKFLLSSCHQLLGLKYADGKKECNKFMAVGQKSSNFSTRFDGCYNISGGSCSTMKKEVC